MQPSEKARFKRARARFFSFYFLSLVALSVFGGASWLSNQAACADEDPTPLFGHNLDATTDTFKKGQGGVGDLVTGYGITDGLMVETSPWLVVNYNMAPIGLKYAVDPGFIFDRVSIEGVWLRTYQFLFDAYHQNSTFARLTGTVRVKPSYRLHFNLGVQYFFDDLAPFSLRPPPISGTPVTTSVGVLQEIHFSSVWGIFLESGILGINYPNRYVHLGASAFFEQKWGYIQLGLSKSIPFGPNRLSGEPAAVWTDPSGKSHASVYYDYAEPVHPEVQIEILL